GEVVLELKVGEQHSRRCWEEHRDAWLELIEPGAGRQFRRGARQGLAGAGGIVRVHSDNWHVKRAGSSYRLKQKVADKDRPPALAGIELVAGARLNIANTGAVCADR